MTLNASGIMSIGGSTVGASINLELDLAATANSAIGQTNFRELAEVPTGQISLSDFYGKSNVISPASRIQFWGVNSPMPATNGATRYSFTSAAVDVTRQGEVISFGDGGVTTCFIGEQCCAIVARWPFASSSLTVLTFTPEGNLPPSSARNYTWSSAQAAPGFYGNNTGGIRFNFTTARVQSGLKDSSGNYYLRTPAVPNTSNSRQAQIKLNPDLSVAWAKSFLIPPFRSDLDFSYTSITPTGDVYRWSRRFGSIIKINSSGVLQWSYDYGVYSENGLYGLKGIGGDNLGNCYMVSQPNGSFYRLDKLDSTGTWVKGWNWPFPTSSTGYGDTVISEDNAGNIWIFIGSSTQTLDILKFDANFNLIWQRTLTSPIAIYNTINFVSPKFDNNNNCILLTNAPIDNAPPLLTSYSADGTLLWSRLVNKVAQTADIAFSQDFTKIVTAGTPAEREDISPYYYGFSRADASDNIGLMVLPVPVAPRTSNPLSNGTVNVTITITTGGTSSTPTRTLTALSAPSRTASLAVTLENIAVNVSTTFPFVAKISEQLL